MINNKEILIVVDMQDKFLNDGSPIEGSKDSITGKCCDEIKKAKEKGLYIFLVEFKGYGPTTNLILQTIGDYERVEHVIKAGISGWNAFKRVLSQEKFDKINLVPEIVNVCGIYSSCCVEETVKDFLRRKYIIGHKNNYGMKNYCKVKIIKEACYPKDFKQYLEEPFFSYLNNRLFLV